MQFCGLRPFALAFQRFRLLRQTVIFQTAFDIVDTAPLAGGKRSDKRGGFLRRLLAIKIRQPAYSIGITAIHTQRLLIITFGGGIIFARHRHIPQPQYRVAVGVIHCSRLLIETLRLGQIIRF
ncbi:Uncharacterised protein [Salmonella enterica subsp. enterica serovar Bovismorbificans]|uniref:Uncharacterized protein n=1 Tax=Salmonella enterica subsp. enterica serovar Bovismorbificans TaxID=58097 RepID=A0A655BVH4_SALET|nr:Uncharacterised protein [Salmonella enterica subsp. enterica serovar Bovismorbificans]CNU27453.1 Uncharacterised protein [Salmonella enterica subsp. enterica serovar Bovismorbificans]CNU37456.1 Uncharacterised protein [Salmonella enterica subsp. enterica serovar Bovismorbificans]CNU46003.1 Uncharacterised protein [Salmonella enterica subsp. enterica serovar Bovismorbificans]CQB61928.1 Uncharacterised protein [Salmonella enterica subsp. enterica serovar Bovismorbificans]